MNASHWSRTPRGATLLFTAAVACLLCAVGASIRARQMLIGANASVTHTDEVRLAVADGQLAIARRDVEALGTAVTAIEALTVDNPHQQRNIARVNALREQASLAALDEVFMAMDAEEDRLRVELCEELSRAQARCNLLSATAIVLTLLLGFAGMMTMRKQRSELARQRALMTSIVDNVDEGVVAVDIQGKQVALNAAARAMLGTDFFAHAMDERGRRISADETPIARALRGESAEGMVLQLLGKRARWVSATARPVMDAEGRMLAAVTTLRDVTRQRAATARLRDLSLRDDMTGLLNRRGFFEIAGSMMIEARENGAPVALLFADVDGLKTINDELGHREGDRAIVDAAEALRSALRQEDVIARLGGDEFVALLSGITPGAHDALLARVQECAAERSRSLSVGITSMSRTAPESLGELLAKADELMYERKRARTRPSTARLRPTGTYHAR